MNEVKVFIGYQFHSSQLERGDLKKLLFEACEQVRSDLNQGHQAQVTFRPILVDLLSYESPSEQVLSGIAAADLCVFEMSELSPEALVGIGYALGQGKPCIYLQHEDEAIPRTLPDLSEVSVLRFSDQTLSDRFVYELYRQVSEIIDKRITKHGQSALRNDVATAFRSLWGLEDENTIYVVCSERPESERPVYTTSTMKVIQKYVTEIPESERSDYVTPNAKDFVRLAKFADVETLFLLKAFLGRYFPNLQVFECTCSDMPHEANAANRVSVGGIAWNRLTAQITRGVNLPFVQRDGGAGNPDPIDDIRNESRYLPIITKDGTVHEDIGYFVRVPNPINRKKLLCVVNGILTFGVLGVARCFTEGIQGAGNCSHILEQMGKNPYFAALLRVPVINNYAAVPNIAKRGMLIEILGYSPERNEFT